MPGTRKGCHYISLVKSSLTVHLPPGYKAEGRPPSLLLSVATSISIILWYQFDESPVMRY